VIVEWNASQAWASAVGEMEPCPPWIFRQNTDKLGEGLMVLFFGLVLSVAPPLLEI